MGESRHHAASPFLPAGFLRPDDPDCLATISLALPTTTSLALCRAVERPLYGVLRAAMAVGEDPFGTVESCLREGLVAEPLPS